MRSGGRNGVVLEELVQVAGVIDAVEARLLVDCDVRWLGFPLRLPVHVEDLTEREAAAVVATLPAGVEAVLITYLDEADAIVDFCRDLGTRAVQLHGELPTSELARLAQQAPDLVVFKSLVVAEANEPELQRLVDDASPYVDAFLTDTFDPTTGARGATGRVHDWSVSRRLVERSPRPVILAGGLTPENVRPAIRAVRPAGVDVHTGVEGADGRKRRDLVERFVAEARRGFADVRTARDQGSPRRVK